MTTTMGTAAKAGGCGCGSVGWSQSGGCGSCSTCAPLRSAERPRFFGGQRLSAEDLSSEQDYVLVKNRLHNRYLHGWGVVCGLDIGCGPCPGEVTVLPGYALDPCGNDIVVPCIQQFDVLKAVQECRDATRRKRADCDPYEPPPNQGCDDQSEHWCITLRYQEEPRRPTTALRQQTSCGCGGGSSAKSGCGCGGSSGKSGGCGGGCGGSAPSGGCGCGGSGGTTASTGGGCGCSGSWSAPSGPTTTSMLGVCEPSRTFEGFRLGVVQDCGEQCAVPTEALERTFLGRVVSCLKVLRDIFAGDLGEQDRRFVAASVFGGSLDTSLTSQQAYEIICRVKQAVRRMLEDERLPKHCTRLQEFDQIVVPVPDGDESLDNYLLRAQPVISVLIAFVVDHIRDCICDALLPPFPTNPCDDRLILGCVEIRDGQLVEVCGISKRRYAGSFPALSYWLSVGPAIGWLLCRICCDPRLSRLKGGRTRLAAMLDEVDPSGSLRRSIVADDFSLMRSRFDQARVFKNRVQPRNWARGITDLRERFSRRPT